MIHGFTSTKAIEEKASKDYFAKIHKIKYKDKYKRENEVVKDYSFKDTYVRLAYEFDNREKVVDKITLAEDYRFLPLPYLPLTTEEDRSCVYISGASGLGKSYLVNEIVTEYKRFYPSNKIYYITKNNASNDRSLSPKDMYKFIDVNKFIDYYSYNENIEEFLLDTKKKFHNSMFIFDDVASMEKIDKVAGKVLNNIMDIILENKRKAKMSICIISHVPSNYKQTALLIREMHSYICFPKTLQVCSDRILNNYLGLSTKEIERIIHDDSKITNWLMIDNKRRLVLTQREIYFLKTKRPILEPKSSGKKRIKTVEFDNNDVANMNSNEVL